MKNNTFITNITIASNNMTSTLCWIFWEGKMGIIEERRGGEGEEEGRGFRETAKHTFTLNFNYNYNNSFTDRLMGTSEIASMSLH
jgi:hypothetical protein